MQPLLTQVPPNLLRSIIATFIPASASRTARDGPAWPVPITIASYLIAIGIPPFGLELSTSKKEKVRGKLKSLAEVMRDACRVMSRSDYLPSAFMGAEMPPRID